MTTLAIDMETFSDVDLAKCGVYKYASSLNFEVLLIGYAFDDEDVRVVDVVQGQDLPDELVSALIDPEVLKTAYNANFERVCLTKHFGWPVWHPPEQWSCTAVLASTLGLPGYLDGVAKSMQLEQQKDSAGKSLIRYFSMPCKPTKTNGERTRNLPEHDKTCWQQFKDYCQQDVVVEREIRKRLGQFELPGKERRLWYLDQHINDRGVGVDRVLVDRAIRCDAQNQERLLEEAKALTGLDNPGSVAQLKEWLAARGVAVEHLTKAAVAELLETVEDEPARSMLELRQQMAKTSVKKYQALERARCEDDRVRGLLQFYGASRTGRWASRLINIQNLPQNKLSDLDAARGILRAGDYETLQLLYGNVPSVLSQLIRTALVAGEGHRFIVADFASIEARVLAWLAKEQWVLDVFQGHGRIYEMTASRMTGVPLEQITKDSPLRQKGKVATLACIAEGQLVLTDKGLVPIEDVTLAHRVWDGENFVTHEGVLFKGKGEVIAYDGLTATKDHIVWVEGQSEPIQFGEAAASRSRLVQTGDGGPEESASAQSQARLYDIVNAGPHHRFTVSGRLVHNCGYGGSVGALTAMGALKMGLTEEELPGIVEAWRKANPEIVRFWYAVEEAAFQAVRTDSEIRLSHGLTFSKDKGILFVRLPSGRSLAYARPRIEMAGRPQLTYEGAEAGSKTWSRVSTFSGKLAENLTQAIARDCLAEAMLRLDEAGYRIAFTVHDEVILDVPKGQGSVDEVCSIISQPIDWAPGLPLAAAGFEANHYQKD